MQGPGSEGRGGRQGRAAWEVCVCTGVVGEGVWWERCAREGGDALRWPWSVVEGAVLGG